MQGRTLLVATLLVTACGGADTDAIREAEINGDATPDAAPAEKAVQERVASIGATAARELREMLVQRLTRAIETEGPAAAIDVCSTIAPQITDSLSRASGATLTVKRTSERVRNTANRPDDLERQALLHFAAARDSTGDLPQQYIQRTADGYRYYEPLVVVPLCVRCHGPVDSIPADVRAAIAARYPDDRATGYLPGELRGLIRVAMPADAVH